MDLGKQAIARDPRPARPRRRPSRRPAALARCAAATLEALESRRLLCTDHFVGGAANPLAGAYDPDNPDFIDIVVTTDGFEPAADVIATAAPGMPDLNSRPGAPASIFLDFDGDPYSGNPTNPYTDDADGTTFNPAEAAIITRAWEEMSTYFGVFDVNVTTTQPAAGVPTAWVAIGNNINNGYSEVGVFPNSGNRAHSWNNSSHARTRVSGIAHEIGHNFGLNHQSDFNNLGVRTNEYSSGWDLLHGPIMGVDFAQNVHKWFIGHNTNSATSLQDDLTIIGNKIKPYQPPGGDGFRVDDFASTMAAAAELTLNGSTYSGSGVIERGNDVDAFTFNVTSADFPTHISALPHGYSALDVKLTLHDATGALVAERNSVTNGQDLALTLQPGQYFAVVAGHGNYGDVGMYDITVNPLPGGWRGLDVGSTAAGAASYNPGAGTFNVRANNASFSTTDYFRWYYQPLNGDGSITVRVDSLTSPNGNPRAGVMLRETLDSNAKSVFFSTSPQGLQYQYRTTTGGSTSSLTPLAGAVAPIWLRLTRSGTTITAERSTDGATWFVHNTRTLAMTQTAFIGMLVNSNDADTVAFGTFSNVSLTGNNSLPAPTYNGGPVPGSVGVVPQPTGTGLTVSWGDVSGESGYLVERSSDGENFTTAATVAANVTSYNDSTIPGALRWFYRVSSRDAIGGRSAPSAAVHTVNRPSAVTNMRVMSINTSTVVVDWRDTDGENGYRVERSADGGNTWTTLATLAGNVPSYTSNGLTQGITYRFRITPLSSIGDGVSATISGQTRLNAVTGFAFAGIASNQMKLSWTGGVAHATGYRIERSTNGTTFTTLANVASNAATYTDNTVTPLNKYFYRIVATNSMTESVSAPTIRAASPSATPLPTGWAKIDIGSGLAPGAAGFSGSVATVIGSGSVLNNTSVDKLTYLFQKANGDGDLIARVATHESTTSSTGAGIMIRSSFSDASSYVHLRVTSGGIDLIRRGGTITTTHFNVDAPVWFKLTRSGATITGQYSTDGATWTDVGTVASAIPADTPILVGLTTTPQDTTSLVKATFDNIGGSLLNQPDGVAPAAPGFTAISTDSGTSPSDRITSDNTLVISGNAEAASMVTISRSDIGVVGTVQANFLGAFSFDYTGTTLADGVYTFTATAKDASNNLSPTSSAFNVTIDTVRPEPIGWTFNVATQRIEVVFSEGLSAGTVSGSDLTLTNVTTSQPFTVTSGTYTAATNTASYGTGAALIDGYWLATLNASSVADPAGNLLQFARDYDFYYAAGTSGADTYTIRLEPGGGSFEFLEDAQLHTVTRSGLDQIFLNPLGGADSLHLDFSGGVDWMPPRGLAIAATEALRVTGGPGAPTFTFAGNVLSANAWNVDVAPVQSLALAAGNFAIAADLAGRGLAVESAAAVDILATSRLASLAITGNSTVDLHDHDLLINYTGDSPLGAWNGSAYGGITGMLESARTAAGTWDGPGLATSMAQAIEGVTTLGIGEARDVLFLSEGQTALWDGYTVDASTVIVKYTYTGDADLNGYIDAADYGYIDNWIQFPGTSGYYNGDFNYDGIIDAADYGYIDNNIQMQGPPL